MSAPDPPADDKEKETCPTCGATFQCSSEGDDTEVGFADDELCRHGNILGACHLCDAEASPEA